MLINKLKELIRGIKIIYFYGLRNCSTQIHIASPLRIQGGHNIFIKDKTIIGKHVWLASLPLTGEKKSFLEIKEDCRIGDFNHIWATKRVCIEKNVLTANFVYISDNLHDFDDLNTPIMYQQIKQLNDVVIGEGSWIGEHVAIIGASIGKHSVIGANSVVTHGIPDYCVAVGSPAYIIKRYNFDTKKWERTDKNGNFVVE